MKKLLLLAAFVCAAARAQIQVINATDQVANGPAVLNANFSYLNAHVNGLLYPVASSIDTVPIVVSLVSGVTYVSIPNCAGAIGYSTSTHTLSCSNSIAPTSHAASHGSAGSDPVSLDASQVATGVLNPNRLPPCAPSGAGHAAGLLPDAGSSAGTTRFLREDCSWSAINTGNASQLQGRTLASTAPTDLQVVKWNNGASQWEPGTIAFSWISGIATPAQLSSGVDPQSGAGAYAIADSDRGKLISRNQAGAVSDTIAQAGAGGNFLAGWTADYQCRGVGGCTITPTTSTIDGASSIVLTQNQGVRIVSDGSNYFTQRGVGGGGTLSGDVTGPSSATVVGKINGASLPTDGFPVQSNGSGQIVTANVDPYTSEHAGSAVTVNFAWGYCLAVTSTIHTDFNVSAVTGTVALMTAPAGWVPTRVRWVLASSLTTSGVVNALTDVAVSVGTSATPSAFAQYLPASPVRTASADPAVTYGDFVPGGSVATTAAATQVVTAQLAITNANPDTLNHINGGSITFTVCGK